MPRDDLMSASLAYRKNEDAIRRGDVPEKYTRLLPHIPGEVVLELGAAEGVLALLMARDGKTVTALEKSRQRYEAALALDARWSRQFDYASPAFVCGSIEERLDLLAGVDTLVAVRMIYYLRDRLDDVFAAASRHVSTIVLCGNRSRGQWWRDGVPNRPDGADNYYSSIEGMSDLLARHGYRIRTVVREGDPIVVGVRDE